MAWIELNQTVWSHRKTFAVAEALDLPDTYAAAHVARLWCWALDNAIIDFEGRRGLLTGLSARAIAGGAAYPGDPAAFLLALIGSGYLDEVDGDLVLHDWWEYAGKYVERRRADADRKKQGRGGGRMSAGHEPTSDGHPPDTNRHPTDIRRMSHLTLPNKTEPDQAVAATTRARDRSARPAEPGDMTPRAAAPPPDAPEAMPQEPPPPAPTAWSLVEAMIEGLDEDGRVEAAWTPTKRWREKQSAIAAELLADGYGPADVLGCVRWLLTDDSQRDYWTMRTINLGVVRAKIDEWLTNRPRAPVSGAERSARRYGFVGT